MGINTANTSGINTQTAAASDIQNVNNVVATESTPSVMKEPTTDVRPKHSSPIRTVHQSDTSHHERHLKPKGKHNRPQVAPLSQDTQESEKPRKSTKLEFVTVTHGIHKTKKQRKYRCKICSDVSDTQASANSHYRSCHPPIKCDSCPKIFNNPNSFRRHKYSHTLSLKYPCHTCRKSFPFKSDLSYHCLKHKCNPGFMCNHEVNGGICRKWFFTNSDLTKHAKTHSGTVYSCYECNYTTLDMRYLQAHCYTHSDKEHYKCEVCNKTFKHHTQLLRHRPCYN